MAPAREFMTPGPECIRAGDSVREAARKDGELSVVALDPNVGDLVEELSIDS